ncbi:hypothetical protein CEXT_705601 [Caerostris extrusa]|uniref:Uncharacterized protein n=1 Tax=Caerostris extrusa TaxID=172846 RepID=A0AAV4MPC3_CAEEX|nr:hypothetical protein CEXT_705601 [Caerostris extrusa]
MTSESYLHTLKRRQDRKTGDRWTEGGVKYCRRLVKRKVDSTETPDRWTKCGVKYCRRTCQKKSRLQFRLFSHFVHLFLFWRDISPDIKGVRGGRQKSEE